MLVTTGQPVQKFWFLKTKKILNSQNQPQIKKR